MNKVYIELGEAIDAIRSSRGNCDDRFYDEGLMDACSEIIGLKPADVELVRHGEWIIEAENSYRAIIKCSCCETEFVLEKKEPSANYCPNCGAKMKEN